MFAPTLALRGLGAVRPETVRGAAGGHWGVDRSCACYGSATALMRTTVLRMALVSDAGQAALECHAGRRGVLSRCGSFVRLVYVMRCVMHWSRHDAGTNGLLPRTMGPQAQARESQNPTLRREMPACIKQPPALNVSMLLELPEATWSGPSGRAIAGCKRMTPHCGMEHRPASNAPIHRIALEEEGMPRSGSSDSVDAFHP